jgi:glutamyl-tRNA synthetase
MGMVKADKIFWETVRANLLNIIEVKTCYEWIKAVKSATDKYGKEIFMPIIKALTNLDHSPELRYVLKIMGYDRAYKRLAGISA